MTYNHPSEVKFFGHLSKDETTLVKSLTGCSTHPLSNLIRQSLEGNVVSVEQFKEWPGKGIEGFIDGHSVSIGSASFIRSDKTSNPSASLVFISIDDAPRGYFSVTLSVRKNLKSMLGRLGNSCQAVLSGDNGKNLNQMKLLFGCHVPILFNQSPMDKLDFIRNIQMNGKKVLMIGDGLNDAGALKQADVGIAVTDDTGVFTPACDGILQGDKLQLLDKVLSLAKSSTLILRSAFVISFCYNAIALSFAVTGHLTPLVAAVLMPISSISVVGFSTLAVRFAASRKLSYHPYEWYMLGERWQGKNKSRGPRES